MSNHTSRRIDTSSEAIRMGLLDGLFRSRRGGEARALAAMEVAEAAADDDEEIVEVEVVGESYRQDALTAIAGPKEFASKSERVGVTLRCEPSNQYDANAIRVEVMGQLVGYVQRDVASVLAPPTRERSGGVLEARGLIVGGWEQEDDEGSFGIRVWITARDAARLEVRPDEVDLSLRPAWPEPPALDSDERRLSPTRADGDAGRYGSTVTVTCEEHYQPTIAAAMPAGWDPSHSWPVLVELVVAPCNPHSNASDSCVEVRVGGQTVGYFTSRMTQRHAAAVSECAAVGQRATALATVASGKKAGTSLLRLKVTMRD